MKKINDEIWLENLTEKLHLNLTNMSNYIINIITLRIGNIFQMLENGKITTVKNAFEYIQDDILKIKNKIENIKKFSLNEINRIFNELAFANIEFANDFYKYRNMPVLDSYKKNPKLVKIVDDIKKNMFDNFKNLSKTTAIGFTDKNGNFINIRNTYIKIINNAVENARFGQDAFIQVMRKEIKQLVKSGLRTAEFENGYSRRIDSQISMNMKDAMRELNHRMQEQVGREFGADGWEISVHALCAPDHQKIQGKQYTKKQYTELNSKLARKIGEMNCRHFATPIIIGVSKPVYTREELQKLRVRSNEVVEYNGKKYTRYEASQIQRKIEAKLRTEKIYRDSLKNAGLLDESKKIQTRIKLLSADYKKFSQTVGLTTKPNRTRI